MRQKYLVPYILLLSLMLSSACIPVEKDNAQATATPSPTIRSLTPKPTETPTEKPAPKIDPVSISWLNSRLGIVSSDMSTFLYKAPIVCTEKTNFRPYQLIICGKGGNYVISSYLPAEAVLQAKEIIEAASLLASESLKIGDADAEERCIEELSDSVSEALFVLEQQLIITDTREEEAIIWARENPNAEISMDSSIEDIHKTYNEYRRFLQRVIDGLVIIEDRIEGSRGAS